MNTSKTDLDSSILTCYMLRNKQTGLYWKGGGGVRCDKNGKVWRKLSHLRCAISQHNDLISIYRNDNFEISEDDFEIIELSYTLNGGETSNYIPFVKEVK